MVFSIRPADPADAPTLTEIQDWAVRAFGITTYTPAQVDAWATAVTNTSFPFDHTDKRLLVADDNGDLVGFAQLDTARAHIDMVFVRPDKSRQGIGTHLVEACEAALPESTRRIAGTVPLNAVPFCQHLGYVTTRRRQLQPMDTPPTQYEVCHMEKQLRLPIPADQSSR